MNDKTWDMVSNTTKLGTSKTNVAPDAWAILGGNITEGLQPPPTTADLIKRVADGIRDMLLQKNAAYGDSAVNPVRVFSKADSLEQINVRIDDKLSRIARGSSDGEDTELDLIGYLILKRVAIMKREAYK